MLDTLGLLAREAPRGVMGTLVAMRGTFWTGEDALIACPQDALVDSWQQLEQLELAGIRNASRLSPHLPPQTERQVQVPPQYSLTRHHPPFAGFLTLSIA